jgi:hypothetical protein
MDKFIAGLLIVLGGIALIVGLSALLALPVMWLWNGLVPNLFHGPEVTFCQAWGLQLLASALFGRVSTRSK